LVNICKKELGIDYVHANELEIIEKLTGNYIGDIVDGKKESRVIASNADKEGIHINQKVM
jgi:phosphoserine phosphatase